MSTQKLDVAGLWLDCADPSVLADFYLALLGGQMEWDDGDTCAIRTPSGLLLVAQRVRDYVPPAWPGRSDVHLDLSAGDDLDAAVDLALSCGATPSGAQPDARWCVLLDPAGHPFCITTVTGLDQPGT